MHCERLCPHLKAYLDQELNRWMRQRVETHLRLCAACRQEMQALEQISKSLRTLSMPASAPHLRERILEQIALKALYTEKPAGASREARIGIPLRWWAYPALGLALTAVLFMVYYRPDKPAAPASRYAQAPAGRNQPAVSSTPAKPDSKMPPAIAYQNQTQAFDSRMANSKAMVPSNVVIDDAKHVPPTEVQVKEQPSMPSKRGEAMLAPPANLEEEASPPIADREQAGQAPTTVFEAKPTGQTEPPNVQHVVLNVKVKDLDASFGQVFMLAHHRGSEVVEANYKVGSNQATLTLRVPQNTYQQMLKELGTQGQVEFKQADQNESQSVAKALVVTPSPTVEATQPDEQLKMTPAQPAPPKGAAPGRAGEARSKKINEEQAQLGQRLQREPKKGYTTVRIVLEQQR